MRILFQGDSITDAGRDHRNYRDMGWGYPGYAADLIAKAFPDADLEFINLGVSGNRTDQLFDRMYRDVVQLQPDVVSFLIGINDVWHRHGELRIETTDAQFETNYRAILDRVKAQTSAKIMILAPFLLDCEKKEAWRPEVERINVIVRKLVAEYADVFVPLDEYFGEALKTQPRPQYYSPDGVHPSAEGAEFIGKHYFDAIEPLLRTMLDK